MRCAVFRFWRDKGRRRRHRKCSEGLRLVAPCGDLKSGISKESGSRDSSLIRLIEVIHVTTFLVVRSHEQAIAGSVLMARMREVSPRLGAVKSKVTNDTEKNLFFPLPLKKN